MFAIIRTGGKQYTVKPGDSIQVEKLDKDLGSEFEINEVLFVGGDKAHIGQPLVKNAKVTCVVTMQSRTRKIIVFKKKRRHSFRKRHNHRQMFTQIFVKSITAPNGEQVNTDETPKIVNVEERRLSRHSRPEVAATGQEVTETKKKTAKATKSSGKVVKKKKVAKKAATKTAKKAKAKK